jgi:DNA-binding protein HU-beta
MIKADIVDRISAEVGISKVQAERAVERVLSAVKLSLARGERIELRGFGVFEVKRRKEGVGRNPRTGEEVTIPSARTTRFKPGKNLSNLPADV